MFKRHKEKEDARMAAAEKIDKWDGPVLVPCGLGYQDGFFADIQELIDYLIEEVQDWPTLAYVCSENPFKCKVDAHEIAEQCCEELFDGAIDSIDGLDELNVALKAFEKTNEGIKTWDPDYKRVVRLPTREQVEAEEGVSSAR